MKPRLTTRVLSLAPAIYQGASAAFWLFIGLGALRVLIRLARMVPMRPTAEATSRSVVGNQQAARGEPVRLGLPDEQNLSRELDEAR
jgi:hypothetical protein